MIPPHQFFMKSHPTNILLVEDNETDVKIILRAFAKQKYPCHIHTVSDGKEALDYLLNHGAFENKTDFPTPDVILLDINMPRMDGHTFVKKIRSFKTLSKIPIVVFTTKEGMKNAFRIEGVNDYVIKTIDGVKMIEKIREIIKFKQEFFSD